MHTLLVAETANFLDFPFDAAVLARCEGKCGPCAVRGKLCSLPLQQLPSRQHPAAAPADDIHEPASLAVLESDYDGTAGPAANALLHDGHGDSYLSATAALHHDPCVDSSGSADATLFDTGFDNGYDTAGADLFSFDDSQSPADHWDDVIHQDFIPAKLLDDWLHDVQKVARTLPSSTLPLTYMPQLPATFSFLVSPFPPYLLCRYANPRPSHHVCATVAPTPRRSSTVIYLVRPTYTRSCVAPPDRSG